MLLCWQGVSLLHAGCSCLHAAQALCVVACAGSGAAVRVCMCSCTVSVRPQGRTVHGRGGIPLVCFRHGHRHRDQGGGRGGCADRQTHFAKPAEVGAEGILGCVQADCRSVGLLRQDSVALGPRLLQTLICTAPRDALLFVTWKKKPPASWRQCVGGCAAHITSRAQSAPLVGAVCFSGHISCNTPVWRHPSGVLARR